MSVDVLVLGGGGLLGTELRHVFSDRGCATRILRRAECDIADPQQVERAIGDASPRWVINCAAYNAVDRAEVEPEIAMRVNEGGARTVAAASPALVHFSSDFVFDGEKTSPYVESDEPRPLSAYARSKSAGDRAVAEANASHIILRVGCLYGAAGSNFGSKLLDNLRAGRRMRVDAERRIQPTWGRSVAAQVLALLDGPRWGLYHAMTHGSTTWAEFGRELARLAGLDAALIDDARSADLDAPAPRPRYAVLENRALAALRLDRMPTWQQSLEDYLSSALSGVQQKQRGDA